MQYAKRGRLRFTSHRDFSRAFERALVRARVPMAYSSGFNPHPRISYAGAAPTGAASEAEYLEIGLSERLDPEAVAALVDAALPVGLDVLRVAESPGGSLGDLLGASRWVLEVGETPGLEDAAAAFLASAEVPVERMTKKGRRTFDARAAVVTLTVTGPGTVEALIRHTEPMVRPDDVVNALMSVGQLQLRTAPLFTRTAQGRLADDHTLIDPLDA